MINFDNLFANIQVINEGHVGTTSTFFPTWKSLCFALLTSALSGVDNPKRSAKPSPTYLNNLKTWPRMREPSH